MAGGNPSKLNPCTPENARERQLKSAEKRKENNAKKKGYDRFRVFYFYEGKE